MKHVVIMVAVILIASGCSTATKQPPEAGNIIKRRCRAFVVACNERRLDDAKSLLASMVASVPASYVESRLNRYSELSFSDLSKMKEVKVEGDKAILVYWESPTDADPIYFARENGDWKVLLPLTKYQHWVFSWGEGDLTSFGTLAAWFSTHKSSAPQ